VIGVMGYGTARETAFVPPVAAVDRGGLEIIEKLAEEWRDLCNEAVNDEPFYRPEWITAYVRAFAPRDTLVVLTARSNGRLVAVLPLAETRTWFDGLPATRLRGLANVHSCRFDMLRAAGPLGVAAVHSIWSCLKKLPGWNVMEFRYVPEGAALEQLQTAASADGFPVGSRELWRTPYVPTAGWDGTWDFWIRQTGSNFRHTIRRIMRKFDDEHRLRLYRVETADSASLERFYEVEASGWKGGEGTAIRSQAQTRQFYDEVARGAARFGYLALYFLEIEGRPAAAHFGLRYRDRYLVPKCAYDESFAKWAPGHLIVNGILRDCAESGLREFDFLGPVMEWKEKWTSESRAHLSLYIFNRGLYGSLLRAARLALRPAVGTWLRRLKKATASAGNLLKRQTL
jgi:CelD/BcsL family acetyltransferase involved in cellulose biosynthesis